MVSAMVAIGAAIWVVVVGWAGRWIGWDGWGGWDNAGTGLVKNGIFLLSIGIVLVSSSLMRLL